MVLVSTFSCCSLEHCFGATRTRQIHLCQLERTKKERTTAGICRHSNQDTRLRARRFLFWHRRQCGVQGLRLRGAIPASGSSSRRSRQSSSVAFRHRRIGSSPWRAFRPVLIAIINKSLISSDLAFSKQAILGLVLFTAILLNNGPRDGGASRKRHVDVGAREVTHG